MHAKKCVSQNKIVFIYVFWRKLAGLDDDVYLNYIIAVQTKNVAR